MKKYHIITLGCKVNSYESEAMGEILKQHDYLPSSSFKDNDVIIINTCSVTHVGDAKSRKMIRKAINNNKNAVCVVVGCYAQMASELIKDIEGVDVIIGTRNRELLYDYIKQHLESNKQIIDIAQARVDDKYDFLKVTSYSENTRAYLKIQDGCNNFCSYCIIPYARGSMRSRNKEDILNEAQQLVNNNFKEIVLTGIHTAGYGDDLTDYKFYDLVYDMVTKVNGLKRLRISSIEASQISDQFIELVKDCPLIVKHLHIPLQAGSDSVLKRMNRKYKTDYYLNVIDKIRNKIPLIAITTDVIVGFPQESDEEFNQTVEFIKKINYSSLHVFPFSKRSGTPASKMSSQVDEKVKTNRVNKLVELSKALHKNYISLFLNTKLDVLFETYDDKQDEYIGYTQNYIKVRVKSSTELHNQIKEVVIKTILDDGSSIGELV